MNCVTALWLGSRSLRSPPALAKARRLRHPLRQPSLAASHTPAASGDRSLPEALPSPAIVGMSTHCYLCLPHSVCYICLPLRQSSSKIPVCLSYLVCHRMQRLSSLPHTSRNRQLSSLASGASLGRRSLAPSTWPAAHAPRHAATSSSTQLARHLVSWPRCPALDKHTGSKRQTPSGEFEPRRGSL